MLPVPSVWIASHESRTAPVVASISTCSSARRAVGVDTAHHDLVRQGGAGAVGVVDQLAAVDLGVGAVAAASAALPAAAALIRALAPRVRSRREALASAPPGVAPAQVDDGVAAEDRQAVLVTVHPDVLGAVGVGQHVLEREALPVGDERAARVGLELGHRAGERVTGDAGRGGGRGRHGGGGGQESGRGEPAQESGTTHGDPAFTRTPVGGVPTDGDPASVHAGSVGTPQVTGHVRATEIDGGKILDVLVAI